MSTKNTFKILMNSILMILVLNFVSCSSNETTEEESNGENEVEVDSLEVEEIAGNDMSSPSGKVISELYASSNIIHYFCEDGSYWRNEDGMTFYYGKWHLNGEVIEISFDTKTTLEGIGEPLEAPTVIPGNYFVEYESYDSVETEYQENEKLDWADIKQLVDEDPSYPYVIEDESPVCPQ
ncbi:MAG: hypothetical protein R2780_09485 [Crocinitomicaceae bacterium]|nr:hypothetical protein [Crocinitomicaceae bacterium]